MKLVTDYNTLVIIGLWNRHIFTPEWVGKFLLPDTELTAEYPLNIEGSFRVSSDKLRIFVIGNRLHIIPLIDEISVFDSIQETALKIGTYLPHTPVNAVGVNFLFKATRAELKDDVFNLPDLPLLAANSIKPFSTTYRHAYKKENRSINLSASVDGDNVSFEFNNHFEIKTLVDFKELISRTSIVTMLRDAESVLNGVYIKK